MIEIKYQLSNGEIKTKILEGKEKAQKFVRELRDKRLPLVSIKSIK